MDAACTKALAGRERRRHIAMIEEQGIAVDGSGWLRRVEAETMAALEARGEATATELREEVPDLAHKLVFGEGKKWGGEVGISTRILFMLATDGKILRGRPRGSWLSSQYRWAPVNLWIEGGLAVLRDGEARVELARRWLAAFGPGTLTDLKWWTGWTVRNTRQALEALGAQEVALDGESASGFVLPGDDAPAPDAPPWVALLPGLDPTTMGWKERSWYLGEHAPLLFDRNGNAGPTVWMNGRVIGGWAQAKSGEIVVRLLDDVGREAEIAVAAKAADLEAWLGDTRITPRFRTPVDKALSLGL
jgi:hypothetical protein